MNSREKWGKVGEKEMGSFRGLHTASLDQKGRLNLPSKFRKQFTPEADDMVVLMKTDLPCLLLFPQDVFSNFEQEILAKRKESSAAGRMSRKLMSSIDEEKLDKQGRLLVKQRLQNAAGLKKEVIVLGNITHMELWDPEEFEKFQQSANESDEAFLPEFGL